MALTLRVGRVNAQFSLNGVPFNPPAVPVLLQILSGARNANELLPTGGVLSLPANKTIEVSIPGGGNVSRRV